ncbi:MAG: hypothetical protein ACOYOS_16105 [Syntrophales bacterium]
MPFVNTWNYIQTNLKIGAVIDNWTKDKQYFGDKFTISNIALTQLDIDTPGAKNIQKIPQIDFQGIYNVWPQYIGCTYSRDQIRDNITRYSKYIISILKWVENSNGGTLP